MSEQFKREFLDAHNNYRARHGSPPLELDDQLCAYATEWANNLASRNTLQHRSNNRYGENLFMASGQAVKGADAVKAWYDEISSFNFSNPGFGMNTGHFTQVVWKDSRKLGVGVAIRGPSTYVVANYDPAGNFQGRYPQNVNPPQY